jgi:hypothetical protein
MIYSAVPRTESSVGHSARARVNSAAVAGPWISVRPASSSPSLSSDAGSLMLGTYLAAIVSAASLPGPGHLPWSGGGLVNGRLEW